MILEQRKANLKNLAEFIAEDFCIGNITELRKIARFEGVPYYYDNYEDAFDGMLVYDSQDFHIHINTDSGNTEESKRGRFTFAHELAHYFIDQHRLGLKYGILKPHASFNNLNTTSIIEEEANYFAGCLLMPSGKFKKAPHTKKFSLKTIISLSESFNVSLPSSLIRFADVGTHEIFAVVSKNGKVQWFASSNDFPKWKFNFKRQESLPEGARVLQGQILNEALTDISLTTPEIWFLPNELDARADRILNEQCYYAQNYVVTLLWFN